MKIIKLNGGMLRRLVREELLEANTMQQARTKQASKQFVAHLQAAKQALSELAQASTDPKSLEQGKSLLDALNRINSAFQKMFELN